MKKTNASFADPIDYEDRVLVPLGLRAQTPAWRAVIKGIYGSPLTDDELAIYKRLSGGLEPRAGGAKKVLLVFGRRAGKSTAAARLAWFEATQRDHWKYLEPGQIGSVSVVAQDLAGATQVVNYAQGLAEIPSLKRAHVSKVPVETIELKNALRVEKVTAAEAAVRSRTAVTVVADELAFWDHSGPDEDKRVMRALEPSLLASSNMPTRRLIAITSAGYRRGLAFEIFERDYGKDNAPWLVLHGSTLDLRPDLTMADLEEECAGDPGKLQREYLSQWSDLAASGFFSPETIKAAVSPKAREPYAREGVRYYVAIDPSFQHDAFALAVACSTRELIPGDLHGTRTRQTRIVHTTAWQPKKGSPLQPSILAQRVAEICRRYGTNVVYSDQHEANTLAECFRRYGIKLVKRSWHSGQSDDSKAGRFLAVRQALNDGALLLPDNDPDLVTELLSIVSYPLPSGGIRIEGASKHDDRALAMVLAASEALASTPTIASASMTPWERNERADRMRRLALAAYGAGGSSLGIVSPR